MVKLVYCLRRLPHLSLEEFQTHWLEYHSQFGRRMKSTRCYVQYHTLAKDPIREAMVQAAPSSVEPFDGFAVAWWDSLEAVHAEMKSSDVAAALEDEKLFIDHSRSVACMTQEHVIVEPEGSAPYVMVECLRRRSDLTRKAFQDYWLNVHADFGRRVYEQGGLSGYIQNHTILEAEDVGGIEVIGAAQEPWDGIAMAYFNSVAQFRALVASPIAAEESLEDEKKFIDHERSVIVLTRRHVIKGIVR